MAHPVGRSMAWPMDCGPNLTILRQAVGQHLVFYLARIESIGSRCLDWLLKRRACSCQASRHHEMEKSGTAANHAQTYSQWPRLRLELQGPGRLAPDPFTCPCSLERPPERLRPRSNTHGAQLALLRQCMTQAAHKVGDTAYGNELPSQLQSKPPCVQARS